MKPETAKKRKNQLIYFSERVNRQINLSSKTPWKSLLGTLAMNQLDKRWREVFETMYGLKLHEPKISRWAKILLFYTSGWEGKIQILSIKMMKIATAKLRKNFIDLRWLKAMNFYSAANGIPLRKIKQLGFTFPW